MSDELLKALGRVAREQAAADPPAELLQPPAPAAKDAIVARAVEAFGRKAPPAAPRVVRTRWWVAVMAPVALAAAGVALFVGGRPAMLPAYALEARGGIAETRSAGEARPLVLERGAPLTLVLRPATPVEGALDARVFLVAGERRIEWTAAERSISPEGAVRLEGVVAEVPGTGPGLVVVAVGRPGTLPTAADALAPDRPGVLTQPVSWR